jgi:hypothetical protein
MEQQVVTWVKYDDKIKEYQERVKKLREERDKIGESLIQSVETNEYIDKKNLPKYNITQMNSSLAFQQSKTYENYTNKFYEECFTEFLGSEDKARELLEFMKNKRKVETKITLKRGYLMEL